MLFPLACATCEVKRLTLELTPEWRLVGFCQLLDEFFLCVMVSFLLTATMRLAAGANESRS